MFHVFFGLSEGVGNFGKQIKEFSTTKIFVTAPQTVGTSFGTSFGIWDSTHQSFWLTAASVELENFARPRCLLFHKRILFPGGLLRVQIDEGHRQSAGVVPAHVRSSVGELGSEWLMAVSGTKVMANRSQCCEAVHITWAMKKPWLFKGRRLYYPVI